MSENGKLQAQRLAAWFTGKELDIILSSSSLRAQTTAEAIKSVVDVNIEIVSSLKERQIPEMYSNKTSQELTIIRSQLGHTYSDVTQDWYCIENVESDENVLARVKDALAPFVQQYSNIVCVTHAGVIKALLHSIFKIDTARPNVFKVRNGCAVIVQFKEELEEMQLIEMHQFT